VRLVARLVVDYFSHAAHLGASARHTARCQLLFPHRTSGCLGTSRGLSRGSSSTTSRASRVRVPWHITRLVTRLTIDYFAYAVCPAASARRGLLRLAQLIVDYFTYIVRLGASARRAARRRLLRLCCAIGCLNTSRGSSCGSSSATAPRASSYATRLGASARRAARRAACRRLLRLRRASGCLGTSRGSLSTSSTTPRVRVPRHVTRLVVDYFTSRRFVVDYFASRRLVVDYFASRRLIVDYFAYAVRPGASAHRVARHAARRQLLRLRRASGCLGTSRGSSRRPSSTTSTMPPVWVPQHVAWLVASLVIDYFAYATRPGASTCRAARHAARCQLLRALRLRLAATLALLQPCCESRLLVSRQHRLYFEYATRRRDVVFRSHHVDHSSRLVFQTSRERQSRPQQLIGINSD
jgi:hypothetical protein